MPATEQAADVDAAASAYAEELEHEDSDPFDIVMLSLGPDGHVASLFPDSPQLGEDGAVVGVDDSPKPPAQRVTLTRKRLSRSHAVWLMASGQQKAEAVEAALASDGSIVRVPGRGVEGMDETIWFLDKSAASLL